MKAGLNARQRKAVAHLDGPALILAGPGSGKTTVITQRVRSLVLEAGVPGENILVITFTRAAAEEMKARFVAMMDGDAGGVRFGTFHSVFFSILRSAYGFSSSSILTEKERYSLVSEIAASLESDIPDLNDFSSALLAEISLVKNNSVNIENYYARNCSDQLFRQIYTAYDHRLRALNKLDYDDILCLTLELLSARRDILSAWQERFRYILIDEFQDINLIQYRVVRLLAQKEKNLFVVGDDDQSIYRFRGAKPEIMLGFTKDYPEAERITLNVNYRSDANIVAVSEKLISYNKKRFVKNMKSDKPGKQPVTLKICRDVSEECRLMTECIQKSIREGIAPEDIAVLFRTNMGSRLAMDALMKAGIPFHLNDTLPNLFSHWIALDIIAYLRIINGPENLRADWLRVMNHPNRYLKREALAPFSARQPIASLREYYRDRDWMLDRIDRLAYDLEIMKQMAPYAAVHYIGNAMHYLDFLKDYAKEHHIPENELTDIFEAVRESSQGCKTAAAWFAHIDDYSEELKKQAVKQGAAPEGVALSTLHSAKGLEYRVVIIPDVNEDNIPHVRAAQEAELEEERRLFYVGITRAMERLYLFAVSENAGRKKPPSRFLAQLDTSLKGLKV